MPFVKIYNECISRRYVIGSIVYADARTGDPRALRKLCHDMRDAWRRCIPVAMPRSTLRLE
jgi:hypothetical protein